MFELLWDLMHSHMPEFALVLIEIFGPGLTAKIICSMDTGEEVRYLQLALLDLSLSKHSKVDD